MSHERGRVILVDGQDSTREVTARRLRAQGYIVEDASDPASGASLALASPPDAVIADLWMPSISGVQLCRLLRSEAATTNVPVVLCGDGGDPRNRFWAERAGAAGYVAKGRTGELVRVLDRAIADRVPESDADGFFIQMSGDGIDVRDRIAKHLDKALFESVLASEVRGLASCDSLDRLFDLFAQFVSQVARYRWLAISTTNPPHFAVHTHPSAREAAEREARAAMSLDAETPVFAIEDEDALATASDAAPIVRPIPFGPTIIGHVAFAPIAEPDSDTLELLSIIARELGGPLRMALLVEDSQRLAATDPLTALMNRRSFVAMLDHEIQRSQRYGLPLSLFLLDVDHFKQVNDKRGHAAGDRVLAAIGRHLRMALRRSDLAARWGGEEFVVALPSTPLEGAKTTAERLRVALETMIILDDSGEAIPVTASIGVTEMTMNESVDALVDRADQGMYVSKGAGRNRVTVNAAVKPPSFASRIVAEQMDKTTSRHPSQFVADAE